MRNAFFSLGSFCLLVLIGLAIRHELSSSRLPSPARNSPPQQATEETAPARPALPGGTFYMVRYAAVRTPAGVYGFEPGCEVRLLQSASDGQPMLVSDGQQTIEVEPALLTDNAAVADAVRRADQAAQTAIFEQRMRDRWTYEISHRPIFIAHAQSAHAAELLRLREAAISGGSYRSSLETPAQPVGLNNSDDGANSATPHPARTRPVPSVMDPEDAALYNAVNDLSTSPRTMLSGTR